jgi:hypothetical protein
MTGGDDRTKLPGKQPEKLKRKRRLERFDV